MTLLILAAGMGSRYGGLKQLDPITEQGEFIIDFSVYDAVVSGFDKVVFVIKEENLDIFRDTIGKRFEDKVKVEYVFQKLCDLPAGHEAPEGRVKPWGTAQAMLAARDVVKEPFAVINADDFYGRDAYMSLASHFESVRADAEVSDYCMVGYVLENTLTENGTVSRGVCEVDAGYLVDVTERTKIAREGDVAVYTEDEQKVEIPLDSIVSMNCWGFTPDIFDKVMEGFDNFLKNNKDPMKGEYYLPFAVREIMERGECTVKVYTSRDAWYGVTYHEDREAVVASLKALKDSGKYPTELNKSL